MGLIEFVKDAGESLLGAKPATATPAEKSAAPAAPTTDLPTVLARSVELLGIPVENLAIEVNGETVIVSGLSPTQADREKLVLLLGNTKGIAHVDDRLTVKTPEPEATFYTVVSGDSLSKIAKAQIRRRDEVPRHF